MFAARVKQSASLARAKNIFISFGLRQAPLASLLTQDGKAIGTGIFTAEGNLEFVAFRLVRVDRVKYIQIGACRRRFLWLRQRLCRHRHGPDRRSTDQGDGGAAAQHLLKFGFARWNREQGQGPVSFVAN